MSDPIRPPTKFGNHEANAELRYVEVYEILEDPEPEGEEEVEEAQKPYQPVQVKSLIFKDYVPSATDIIDGGTSDVVVRTVKSGRKHGIRGDGLAVSFLIDAGLTPNALAAFSEDDAELTIKAKNDDVTWDEVGAAVAAVLGGAFILEAVNPAAAIGEDFDGIVEGMTGGVDGGYETYGDAYGIGDRDLKEDVEVGDKLWITWRKDANRWDRLTGEGGGGSSDIMHGIIVDGALPAATGVVMANWAEGYAIFFDSDTGQRIRVNGTYDPVKVYSSDFEIVAEGRYCKFEKRYRTTEEDGRVVAPLLLVPGCNLAANDAEEPEEE